MLETGDTLTPAMRLYEGAGFHACDAFGPYRTMRQEQIERSRFFEKRLD